MKMFCTWAFVTSCAVLVGFWALALPPFEFPDEQAHFGTVSFLIKEGRVPAGEDMDMTPEMARTQKLLGIYRDPAGNNRYTYHPDYHLPYSGSLVGPDEPTILLLNQPDLRDSYIATEAARYPRLSYDYYSIFTRPVWESDILTRLFVTRLGNLFLTATTTFFLYQLGKLLFVEHSLAFLLPALVFLQPMYSFVSAGVNSDNLHNTLFVAFLYFTIRLIIRGLSITPLLFAGLTILVDLSVKPQGVVMLPLFFLALIITLLKTRSFRQLGYVLLTSAAILYLAYPHLSPYLGVIGSGNAKGRDFFTYLQYSANKLVSQNSVWYWGVFKWLGVVLPPIYWRVANRVVLVSGLGLVVYFVKALRKHSLPVPLLSIIYLLSSIIAYTVAIYYFDWHYVKNVGFSLGIQARYFFPTIAAQMVLLITGLLSFSDKKSWHHFVLVSLLTLFIWLQLGGILTIIKSYYSLGSLSTLVNEISQYKPALAKGNIWLAFLTLYLTSLYVIAKTTLRRRK